VFFLPVKSNSTPDKLFQRTEMTRMMMMTLKLEALLKISNVQSP